MSGLAKVVPYSGLRVPAHRAWSIAEWDPWTHLLSPFEIGAIGIRVSVIQRGVVDRKSSLGIHHPVSRRLLLIADTLLCSHRRQTVPLAEDKADGERGEMA